MALGCIGPEAAGPLLQALRRSATSAGAFEALRHMGPKARAAIPGLIQALKDGNESLRRAATQILQANRRPTQAGRSGISTCQYPSPSDATTGAPGPLTPSSTVCPGSSAASSSTR